MKFASKGTYVVYYVHRNAREVARGSTLAAAKQAAGDFASELGLYRPKWKKWNGAYFSDMFEIRVEEPTA